MVRVNTLPGFENVKEYYFVTPCGRLWNDGVDKYLPKEILGSEQGGYYNVSLRIKDSGKKYTAKKTRIHTLIALAFVKGYKPGKTVIHINNKRYINLPNNLKWGYGTELKRDFTKATIMKRIKTCEEKIKLFKKRISLLKKEL